MKRTAATSDPEFDAFWSAYPLKVKKPDAIRAWQQTTKNRPEIARVIAAVNRWSACSAWKRGYVQYPATWLRSHMWNDEPPWKPGEIVPPSPSVKCARCSDSGWYRQGPSGYKLTMPCFEHESCVSAREKRGAA